MGASSHNLRALGIEDTIEVFDNNAGTQQVVMKRQRSLGRCKSNCWVLKLPVCPAHPDDRKQRCRVAKVPAPGTHAPVPAPPPLTPDALHPAPTAGTPTKTTKVKQTIKQVEQDDGYAPMPASAAPQVPVCRRVYESADCSGEPVAHVAMVDGGCQPYTEEGSKGLFYDLGKGVGLCADDKCSMGCKIKAPDGWKMVYEEGSSRNKSCGNLVEYGLGTNPAPSWNFHKGECHPDTEQYTQDKFNLLDADSDGKISAHEISNFIKLEKLDGKYTDKDISGWISGADADGDDQLNTEEYKKNWLKQHS